MRIQSIEITNYKAFLGTHRIHARGKNLFIYGENGSGKSSLYYALKDFFQASIEDIDISQLENVFVPPGKTGKTAVRVTFKPNPTSGKVQGIPCKVLFLDDLFIGLDIANRLPLLSILENEFPDYQVFITTYDKPWFEHARGFLERKSNWKTMEFYAQTSVDGMETPLIMDNIDFITKAETHLKQCDYKAAEIYARSAFEKLIRKHCEEKKKAVIFKSRLKDYTTEDFWKVIKGTLPEAIRNEIETYRPLVLNAFSHYNTERHEIKTELVNSIQAVKNLKVELAK